MVEPAPQGATQPGAPPPELNASKPRRPRKRVIAGVFLILLVVVSLCYYWYASYYESTDDAFIEAHAVSLSARVAGQVKSVRVEDNQFVEKGELLVEIDPRDFEARLARDRAAVEGATAQEKIARINTELTRVTSVAVVEQAKAGVALAQASAETALALQAAAQSRASQAMAQVVTAQASADAARAEVVGAEAEAKRAQEDVKRYEGLFAGDATTRQQLERATATDQIAQAVLEAGRKKVAVAEAQIAEAQAARKAAEDTVRQAEAQHAEALAQLDQARSRLTEMDVAPQRIALSEGQLEAATANLGQLQAVAQQAELALSYTKIVAPEAGRVTHKGVEEGAYTQVGQPLMALVPRQVWVVANFKETQLTHMRPGQSVSITVDAYPDKTFKGHVDSIQAGTGARFSLLPPENATGNYVKVVQRVPVKIVFDEPPDPQHLLGPGMSVAPKVRIK
jgi:membrane fusion protein, multidrug efflux system